MAYAILRTKKLKAPGNVAASASHIERTRPTHNADPKVANEWLIGGPGMYASAKEIWDKIPKKRSDAVHAFEVLLTASPEAFDGLDLDAWKAKNIEWLRQQFRGCEIVGACLHLDESTPHIQAIVIPTEVSKDGVLKLNCKKHLGGAAKLSAMQTSYAKAMSQFGLERGLEGSKAKHVKISQFYSSISRGAPVKFKPFAVQVPPVLLTGKAREGWADAQTKALKKDLAQPIKQLKAEASRAKDMAKRNNDLKRSNSSLSADLAEAKRKQKEAAAQLRQLPLEQVAQALGCFQSKKLLEKDPKMWESPAGKIRIDGSKFFNHEEGKGGGGAFDLVMHINDCTYSEALAFLRDSFDPAAAIQAAAEAARIAAQAEVKKAAPAPFRAPEHVEKHWPRVRHYLTAVRGLAASLIDKLREHGWIGADYRANAYFLKNVGNKTVSAELRGTGQSQFSGSRGRSSEGVFPVIGGTRKLVVCESAIDAISYVQLHPDCSAIATGGTGKWRAALPYLEKHGSKYQELACASDLDVAGIQMAQNLDLPHEPPPNGIHDWNDAVKALRDDPGALDARPEPVARPQPEERKAQHRRKHDDTPSLG